MIQTWDNLLLEITIHSVILTAYIYQGPTKYEAHSRYQGYSTETKQVRSRSKQLIL